MVHSNTVSYIYNMILADKEIKKIAVFRALQLGDMLCAIPAMRALRAALPEAEITLLGLPWAKSLVGRFSEYFDKFIHFPGFPGLPEQPFEAKIFSAFLQQMIDEKFDLVLQMQGNGSIVNPMVELFGARFTAGYYKTNVYAPDNGLFMKYPEFGHEIERHIKLMEFLGAPSRGNELEFPLSESDYRDLASSDLNLTEQQYLCVHPGSRGLSRRWNPQYFAALADMAADEGLIPVITGTKEEMNVVEELAAKMKHRPVIAAGRTSMGAVAALLKNAAGLVSNCTGVSHVAAALKTPSVVVSLDGEPERWLPLNKKLHRSIDWTTDADFNKVRALVADMLAEKTV